MPRKLLMGLDLGGSGVRCLLLDADTGERFLAARSWSFAPAEGTFGIGFDLELDAMWGQVGEACREAVSNAGGDAGAVASIGVSALRFGNVLLDPDGSPLFAVPNRDARGAGECFQLSASSGPEISSETGLWPMPIHASARLLWLKSQRPEALEAAGSLLGLSDWVNYRLCGVLASDPSQAGCTGLFGLASREWSWKRIDDLGLPREIFPDVVDSGTRLGALGESAARDLGVAPGVVIGLAGGDTQCGLLGAGAVRPGDLACIAGTTVPVQAACERPVVDPDGRLWSGHHVLPGRWVIESNGGPMGETLHWIARLLFPDSATPEETFLAEAGRAEIGSAGILSTLGAEVMNARAPSMPVGQITLSHMTSIRHPEPRRHLARAVVEGHACAVRANVEQIAKVTSEEYLALRLSGGMSRSDLIAEVVCDVMGVEVRPSAVSEATAMGAALCGGVAAGIFPDLASAVTERVGVRAVFTPSEARAESSRELYESWSRLRDAGAETTAPAAAAHVTPWVLRSST